MCAIVVYFISMNEDTTNNQPNLVKSKQTYFYLILLLTLLLFAFLTGLFAKKIVRLQNQLKQCVVSGINSPQNTNSDDSVEQIYDGGAISSVLTASTDNWISYSSKSDNCVNFSFKYPNNLYMVLSPNNQNSFDFFESKEASERYYSCVNDPVPAPGSLVPRNHEGACTLNGDLLFTLSVGKYEGVDGLFANMKPSDIIEYSSAYGGMVWRLPKGGVSGEMYGNIGIGSIGISAASKNSSCIRGYVVDISYPYMQSVKDKIISLTKLDPYNLLIHTLSVFKAEK